MTAEKQTGFKDRLVGPKEVGHIDVSKHVGKKVAIEVIEEKEGKYGPFLVIRTKPVETLSGSAGDIQIRGSRLFNLNSDGGTGDLWWPVGGALDTFLRKHNVADPYELIGKEVQLIPVTSKKNGKDYLGFN